MLAIRPSGVSANDDAVAELRKYCKQRGLKNYGKLNKENLILFLKGTSPVQWRKFIM